jgi:hypothetical protein
MNRGIYVKLTRPEDYDDVHPDLVIEDACINPAFEPENVTDEVEALRNLLREMVIQLDTANEIVKGEYPVEEWMDYSVDLNEEVLRKYREMTR